MTNKNQNLGYSVQSAYESLKSRNEPPKTAVEKPWEPIYDTHYDKEMRATLIALTNDKKFAEELGRRMRKEDACFIPGTSLYWRPVRGYDRPAIEFFYKGEEYSDDQIFRPTADGNYLAVHYGNKVCFDIVDRHRRELNVVMFPETLEKAIESLGK